jgi:parvulin-like peptidyl-prolyl isomerase
MAAVTTGIKGEAEQVHARDIVLDSEQTAQQVLALLQQGTDFATVAKEYSVDETTKDNGGDLGWFPRGRVAPELEEAAFALQPGQLSGIVGLSDGYHILQVVERDAARRLSPETEFYLKMALFDEWLAEQRASAVIERHVAE